MEELKEYLNQSKDKLEVFGNADKLTQFNMTMYQLIEVIQDVLSDEEKEKLFEFMHFQNLQSHYRGMILESVKDDNIKLRMIKNEKVVFGMMDMTIEHIIEQLGDEGIKQVLNDQGLLAKYYKYGYLKVRTFNKLSEASKVELIYNKDFIEKQLGLEDSEFAEIVSSIKDDRIKLDIMEKGKFSKASLTSIAQTLSDDNKIKFLQENKFGLEKNRLIYVAKTLPSDKLTALIRDKREFFKKNRIKPYEVVRATDKEVQQKIIKEIEEIGLDLGEKRRILATLKSDVKKELDISAMPKEYVSAVLIKINENEMDFSNYGKIIIDLDADIECYKDMDELISIKATEFSEHDRNRLLKLCEICPGLSIIDEMGLSASTSTEYINSELWINSIIQQMDSNWTQIQKVAFVDNAIGKKISYSPDFDTEVFDQGDSRALWRIINSGYGVCNGIAQVEKYILDRIGIESEQISGDSHSFLKLKNIELPLADGQTIIGDTVLDPTWNLAAQRYGARPNNFCVSYEEIRKHDVDGDGQDKQCHKNDEVLESATIGLDDQALRKVFTSVGLADKDGQFPIGDLFEKSKDIDSQNLPSEENIKKQLCLLKEYCPEFAQCQNSTMAILQGVLLNQENQQFNKCVVSRVYSRTDDDKKSVMYVYIDLPDKGKKFYFADKDKGEFVELSEREFEERFECYEEDMKSQNYCRPWEKLGQQKEEELTKSSGKIVAAQEGGGR